MKLSSKSKFITILSCVEGEIHGNCKFGYSKPPSDETIIAKPLLEDLDEKTRNEKKKLYSDIM